MIFIGHRINKIEELQKTPTQYGVELDLRDFAGEIILEHDPFIKGENFESYLKNFKHKTMILNIKTEGIEFKILDLLKKYSIDDYFFLDCSFPAIVKLCRSSEEKIALRFSEYEPLEAANSMKGKVRWLWIDCFSKLPLNRANYRLMKEWGYQLCLVSPELQGREEDIVPFAEILKKESIQLDAICTKTKNIPLWQNSLNL